MATIMRARFTATGPVGAHPCLFQTFWRPGTGGGSTADATDVLARVRAMLNAAITVIHNSWTFTPVSEVDALEDSTGAITGAFTGTPPAVVTGLGTGEPLPPANAYLVRATSNLIVAGRILKGRTYLPGPGEAQSGPSGFPVTGTVTTLNTSFAGMLTGGATLSFPVVWHRPGAGGAPVGTSGPVVGYQAQAAYFGVQRRRRF